MKKLTLMILMLTLLLPVGSIPSFAQSTEQEIQELKKMVKFITDQEDKDLKYDGLMTFFDAIDLGFYVDTTYQYVFNRGLTDSLQLRALYPDNQQFALNAFTISVSKTPSMEGGLMNLLGFRADILFGEQATELGGEGFDSDVVDPYQAS